MTAFACPAGHMSASSDFCDVCGAPIVAGASGAIPGQPDSPIAPPPPAPSSPASSGSPSAQGAPAVAVGIAATDRPCPNCAEPSPGAALFCDNCGYDFTTGQLPTTTAPDLGTPRASTGTQWVVEVWVDPEWHAVQQDSGPDPCPAAGMPVVIPVHKASLVIGRKSVSRNIVPDIDCDSDTAVSHRHAQLLLDDDHWSVLDLQSSNGTFVGQIGVPLPSDPIGSGPRTLGDSDRVYVGSFTRIVTRRATDQEAASL